MGKLLRTIFLCDYFTIPDFRREMHGLLNRNEWIHLPQRPVFHGRVGVSRARRADELRELLEAARPILDELADLAGFAGDFHQIY